MKRSLLPILISGIFSIGCGTAEESTQHQQNTESILVKVTPIVKTDVNGKTIEASGQFTTADETMLGFKTGGIISKIFVKEGDKISKGQVLAVLEKSELSAMLHQSEIAFEKATRDFLRLQKDSAIALEQFDNAKSALAAAKQQLATSKINVNFSEIRANRDGVVMARFANEGQMVGPGIPVIQTSSKGKSDWILRVAVSDRDWATIKLRDKASVHIEALNKENILGYVFAKAEHADMLTGTFTIDIKLNSARQLQVASGMFGKATISSSQKSYVWKIPYDALLDGNASDGFVFVTNDNKTASKVAVKIADIGKDYVLISAGLDNYKNLIVGGSAYLNNQSSIQVVSK